MGDCFRSGFRGLRLGEAGHDLHERIRSGEAAAHVAPAPRAGYSAAISVHDLSIFVARASELAYLNEQLELAVRGTGRVLFVRGDAGSGNRQASGNICAGANPPRRATVCESVSGASPACTGFQ